MKLISCLELLISISFVQNVSCGSLSDDLRGTYPTQKEQNVSLPEELISKIADFSDDKTNSMIGITSKLLKKMTMKRNKKNNLLQIRKHCGLRQYLYLTSNGHQIFAANILDTLESPETGFDHIKFIQKMTLCLRALTSNIRDISNNLNKLIIYLPINKSTRTPELVAAIDSYLEALDELFERKSNYRKVIITSGNQEKYPFDAYYSHEQSENMIVKKLSGLTIDCIDIRLKLHNPQLFVNPSIRKVSSYLKFFASDHHPVFSNLSSISFPTFDWSLPVSSIIHVADDQDRFDLLRLARSKGVKEIRLPSEMVPEVLSDRYSIEKLNIFGSIPGSEYLNALISTNHKLKALKFGKYLKPSTEVVSVILDKFKSSLTSLSLCFEDKFYKEWDELLGAFLTENSRLIDLEVIHENFRPDSFQQSYLARAFNLKSFSFEGKKTSDAEMQSLLTFFAMHKSLESLNLRFEFFTGFASFIVFYEKFVAAIYQNLSIEQVMMTIDVSFKNCSRCVQLFSEKTKPLSGRRLILNAVPIDNVISDLANGLEDGLFWKS